MARQMIARFPAGKASILQCSEKKTREPKPAGLSVLGVS